MLSGTRLSPDIPSGTVTVFPATGSSSRTGNVTGCPLVFTTRSLSVSVRVAPSQVDAP